MLTEDEMIRAVKAAASLGITKVRITGGEPLVKKNILSICRRCAQTEGIQKVALTTNAILLEEMAKPLHEAGVSRINISLDTLQSQKFAEITRRDLHRQALAGLNTALQTGFEKVKINTVLLGGVNDDEIRQLAELTLKYPVDVRFIELMPMQEKSAFGPEAYISCEKVLETVPEAVPAASGENPGGKETVMDGVARLYRLPQALGNIGLISPVSSHFCAACNRIRLTADGRIKPCLHTDQEFLIKGLDDAGMLLQFQRAIQEKPACHPPLSGRHYSQSGRWMNQIGG